MDCLTALVDAAAKQESDADDRQDLDALKASLAKC